MPWKCELFNTSQRQTYRYHCIMYFLKISDQLRCRVILGIGNGTLEAKEWRNNYLCYWLEHHLGMLCKYHGDVYIGFEFRNPKLVHNSFLWQQTVWYEAVWGPNWEQRQLPLASSKDFYCFFSFPSLFTPRIEYENWKRRQLLLHFLAC